MTTEQENANPRKRLAIIGCGSSGLVCLKIAIDKLTGWDIVCFEKSDNIIGCWGNPYPGFVSTSTKYTTQFACFPKFSDGVRTGDRGTESNCEFFRESEYGDYLTEFAKHFDLYEHICLKHEVKKIVGGQSNGWQLAIKAIESDRDESTEVQHFDCVVICTGVASIAKPIPSGVPQIAVEKLNRPQGIAEIKNKKIVVVGGGESAVDFANRLSQSELQNEVFLSLRSGVRVSPRYHPIRGAPSDFLRNRLMLSIHPDIRNWLGQKFVEWRIKYQEWFEWLFPSRSSDVRKLDAPNQIAKEWSFKLTKAAKDDLFNMFHNKSDDFLDSVGQDRIKIVGPPIDDEYFVFREFDSDERLTIAPEFVVPAIGFEASFPSLFDEPIRLQDFFLSCSHVKIDDLHLIGYARPIIGNIPTISEMQAHFVIGQLSGKVSRPDDMEKLHAANLATNRKAFPSINLDSTFPVEMIPYCDHLAGLCGMNMAKANSCSIWQRVRQQLIPASTMHYFHIDNKLFEKYSSAPIYMPSTLIAFIMVVKPFDWIYRFVRKVTKLFPTD